MLESDMLVTVSSPAGDLAGFVPDDADLDGTFRLIEQESFEAIAVYGWRCEVKRSPPSPFTMTEGEIFHTIWEMFWTKGLQMGRLGCIRPLGEDQFEMTTSAGVYRITERPFACVVESGGLFGSSSTVNAAAGELFLKMKGEWLA
jgi:hypothetical protein